MPMVITTATVTAFISAMAISVHVTSPIIVAAENNHIRRPWWRDIDVAAIGSDVSDATGEQDKRSHAKHDRADT